MASHTDSPIRRHLAEISHRKFQVQQAERQEREAEIAALRAALQGSENRCAVLQRALLAFCSAEEIEAILELAEQETGEKRSGSPLSRGSNAF